MKLNRLATDTPLSQSAINNSGNLSENNDKIKKDQVNSSKGLSLLDGILLIIGSIIGSGIFITPNDVIKGLPSLGFSLIIWIANGIITILGALCYGELGASINSSGAEYVYFWRAFHSSVAYSVLWCNIILLRPIGVAIGAVSIGRILRSIIIPYCESNVAEILIGLLIIFLLTIINCFSVRLAISVNNVLTYTKFISMFIILVLAIIHSAKGYKEQWINSFQPIQMDYSKVSVAIIYGLYSYDGWNTLNFVTNELQDSERNLPIAIITSISVVTCVYAITIACFSTLVGKYGMMNSSNVTATIAEMYMGKAGIILSIFICGSIFGSTNAIFFSGGRLFYVAAHKGHLPSLFGKLHRDRKTMAPVLIFQSIISILFVLIQINDILIQLFGIIAWVTYLMSFIAVLVIRWREPDLPRPYRVPTIVPVLAIILSLIIIILTFINDYTFSLYSLISILISFPIYFIFLSKRAINLSVLTKYGKILSDRISIVFDFIMPLDENEISS